MQTFDMRPKAIVERFGLKLPIFSETAAYGHMGRESFTREVRLEYVQVKENGQGREEIRKVQQKPVEFFTWEKLDYVDKVKSAFGL
jgi:S-adenosylmethionine synthetase